MSKGNHNIYITSTIGLAGLTAVCGSFLFSISTHADDVVDQIEISIPVSCSMTGTGMDSHVTSLNPNETDSDFGATDVSVTCNDAEGFAIYAIGFTDDTNGKTVLTDSTLGSAHDIVTGTATSGDISNWAMKLATSPTATYPLSIENNYNTFQVVPSDYTMVAKRESSTDIGASAVGANFTTSYQVYIGTNQRAGTYEGQVKYVLVHPDDADPKSEPQTTPSGKICYYPASSEAVGTMGCQNVASEVTLLPSNFSRTGYGFAGWSTTVDYSDPDGFYGPQETINLDPADYSTPNSGLSLYAHWVQSTGSLQEWTGCPALSMGALTALTDQRDNETYAVVKLADGNCWMMENIRLDHTAEHNSDGALAQGYGTSDTYGSFAGLATPDVPSVFDDDTTANSLYSINGAGGTISINSINRPGYRMPRYSNVNHKASPADRPENPTSGTAINSTTNAGLYSYGNYYTWHAAIADTTYYDGGDHDSTSICPKGWQIPLGGTSSGDIDQGSADASNRVGSYSYLDRKLGGTGNLQQSAAASKRWRKYPINHLYAGFVFNGEVSRRGQYGSYWTSSAQNDSYADGFYLQTDVIVPGSYDYYKYYGRPLRCIIAS